MEDSAVVWHSGLTKQNRNDLERVQKTAVKVILGIKYNNYEEGLKYLKLDSLEDRRKKLSLNFAKKSVRNEKVKSFFPLNKNKFKNTRNSEKYKVNQFKTNRYKNSSIVYMQNLLNQDEIQREKTVRFTGV